MQDELVYVNTNNVIDCEYNRMAVLPITQGVNFTYFMLN